MSEQEYPSLIRKHWPKYLPETLAGSPPTPSSGVKTPSIKSGGKCPSRLQAVLTVQPITRAT